MTKQPKRQRIDGQFVPIPPDLFVSAAWQSMRHGHILIFGALCKEHASKGGKENGWLKLTHRQIVALGISPRSVAALIRDLEEWGLIVCKRSGMRSPILYGLTWLPMADGTASSNAWRQCRAPENQKSAREREGSPAREREGRSANLHAKGKADEAENLHAKGKALSREGSTQGGAGYSVLRGGRVAERASPGGGVAAAGEHDR